MQVSKNNLARANQIILGWLRFFDMHDHVGPAKDFGRAWRNLPAVSHVIRILKAAAHPGVFFNQDGVAVLLHDFHTGGSHADSIFGSFDFLQNSDNHNHPPSNRYFIIP